jgi:hypothetical protein
MSKKFLVPMVLIALAVVLQLFAHRYYGTRYHQAFLDIISFALLADALWLVGKMIYAGHTPLPAMPAYNWLFRFFAVAAIAIGFVYAARIAGVHVLGH